MQSASVEPTGVFNDDELSVAQSAEVFDVAPTSCYENDRVAPATEQDAIPELPNGMQNERLERQSSFVVRILLRRALPITLWVLEVSRVLLSSCSPVLLVPSVPKLTLYLNFTKTSP